MSARITVVLFHAGAETGAARERLLELGLGEVVETAPELFEAPPAPDIATLFRRDLTAIEHGTRGAHALIVDYAEPSGRRRLRVGDVYQDGWRIARVDAQRIELRRRREVREVAVFELAPEASP
jgi:hypothetical protein